MNAAWVDKFPGSIMVCDREGIILEMNEEAGAQYRKHGGRALIGRNLLDCHPGASREKLAGMLADRITNCYTTEKNGVRRLVYQTPWYEGDEYKGYMELSLELPAEMPHYLR